MSDEQPKGDGPNGQHKKRARKRAPRDEKRYGDALVDIDRSEAFIAFAVVLNDKGEQEFKILTSDDYSGARLLQDGWPMYEAEYAFNLDVDVRFDDEPDDDE